MFDQFKAQIEKAQLSVVDQMKVASEVQDATLGDYLTGQLSGLSEALGVAYACEDAGELCDALIALGDRVDVSDYRGMGRLGGVQSALAIARRM